MYKSKAFSNALWGGLAGAAFGLYASRNFADKIDDMCERCPNEGHNYELSDSAINAKICRECLREYQTNDQVRALKQTKVRNHVIAYAHVYNGVADLADYQLSQSLEAETQLFNFTMTWLTEQVQRAGKTRADVIAAWEKVEAERQSANERVTDQIKHERGLAGDVGSGG